MKRPYYNHDHLWEQRHFQSKPIWGPHSESAYHNILDRSLRLQPKAQNVFDAGCGAGALGLIATELHLQYTGVDESSVAIRMGQSSYPDLDLRYFDLVTGTPEDCRGNFDIITCVNVLHCLTEPIDRLNFLRNLRSLAKPHGMLALSTMCLPVKPNFRKADSPRVYLEPDAIYKEFEQSGWSNIILREGMPADEISPVTNILIIASTG